jgi:hypothetical protein
MFKSVLDALSEVAESDAPREERRRRVAELASWTADTIRLEREAQAGIVGGPDDGGD